MKTHPVLTASFPENLNGGIMICGYNFGYSSEDKENDQSGLTIDAEPPSFFSDRKRNDTRFRNRLLTWLKSWGKELQTETDKVGSFERSFFQTNWLDTQSSTISEDGISIKKLVDESEGILSLIESRRPRVILFTGSLMIEALNDTRIRKKVEALLGARPGNAIVHDSEVATSGPKFKVLMQEFPKATVISVPHVTGAMGVSDEYMAGFRRVMEPLLN